MTEPIMAPLGASWQPATATSLTAKNQCPPHLAPSHWAELVEGSGIAADVAALNFRSFGEGFACADQERLTLLAEKFASLNAQPGYSSEARHKLQKSYAFLDEGGWRFLGDGLPLFSPTPRWKPNKPRPKLRKDADGQWHVLPGKFIKYEAQPKRRPGLLVPQVPLRVWQLIADRHGLLMPADRSAGFWAWVMEQPSLPITICEGEKKACALLGLGLVVVGLAGIELGRQIIRDEDNNRTGEQLVPELQDLAGGGRTITICFDADPKADTARNVRRAAMRLGHALEQGGALAKLAQLELLQGEKCGPDDLLVALGADALLDVLAAAVTLGEAAWLARYWAERGFKPTIIAPSMAEAELPTAPVVGIRAGKGSGKTTRAARWVAEASRVLAPTHRRSLGVSMANRLGLVWLNGLDRGPGGSSFVEAADGSIQQWEGLPPRLSLCLDSLLTIRPQDYAGMVLLIDEAEQSLNHLLTSATCKETRGLLIQRLQQLVACCSQVVLLDADLSDATLKWFQQAKAGADLALLVADAPVQSWPVFWYDQSRPELAQAALLEAATAGPVIISTDSRERAAALHDLLQHHQPQARGILITSETTGDPEVKAWQDKLPSLEALEAGAIRWVVASPSISSGISIEHSYFQSVWGFYGAGTMDDAEAAQALARVRPAVPRHVWVNPVVRQQHQPLSKAWWPQQVEADLRRSWDDQSALMRVELQPDLLLEPDPGAAAEQFAATVALWAELTSRRNYSLAHLRAFIRARLIHEGHTITPVIEALEPEAEQELKALKAQLKGDRKQAHAQAVVAAPIISKAEAERQRRLQQHSPALQRRALVERLALEPEALTVEMVAWGEQWAGAAERLALLLEPSLAPALDVQRIKATTAEGQAPLPWDQSFRTLRNATADLLGLRAFIEAFPLQNRLWDKNTPEVQKLAEKARERRLLVGRNLGLTIKAKDTDTALVGTLLRSYGITTTTTRRGSEARMYGADREQLQQLKATADRLRQKLSGQAPPRAEKGASLNKTARGGAPEQHLPKQAPLAQLALPINGNGSVQLPHRGAASSQGQAGSHRAPANPWNIGGARDRATPSSS